MLFNMKNNNKTKLNIIIYDRSKTKKVYFIAFTVILLLLLIFIYFNNPQNQNIICPSLIYFKIYCSACGILRATYNLLHFNFAIAFFYNSFYVLSMPIFIYLYIAFLIKIFFKKDIFFIKNKKTAIIMYFILFLIFGILRNFEIFSFLAPHNLS